MANIIVTKTGSGSLSAIVTPLGGNEYSVFIEVSGLPSGGVASVKITSNASDIITQCFLEAYGEPSVGVTPLMTVNFSGNSAVESGAIECIEAITYNPPLPRKRAANIAVTNITLDPTAGSGRIGNAAGTTRLQAMSFGTILCRELTADIEAPSGYSPGNINTIDVDGDMTGNIKANNLTSLLVDGDIGASGSNVTIDVDGNLGTLNATNVYANIDIDGNLSSMHVYGSSMKGVAEAVDAVFDGSLDCETMNLGAGLRIWGDLDANVNIADEMTGAIDPASNSTRIAIGDDLNGNITIGSGGMNRGITIGWMESATGAWNGTIEVDSETLSPDYTELVTGGGAVGLVPYDAHFFECDPHYTGSGPGSIAVTGTETKPITIVHYGYIGTLASAPSKPYVVYQAPGAHCTSGCSAELFADKTSEWSTTSIGATAAFGA